MGKQLFASVFSICKTVPLNKENHVSVGTLHFQIIVPPTNSFLSPLPPPLLINFPDFVLQIFQRLIKLIVLFAKLYAV